MLAYNQCFPERQVKGAVFPLIERERIGPSAETQPAPRPGEVDTVDTLSTSSNSRKGPQLRGMRQALRTCGILGKENFERNQHGASSLADLA